MNFTKINPETWKRREVFEFYQNTVPCSFSLTTELELGCFFTQLAEKNLKFYPVFVWLLSTAFHSIREFHYAFDENKELGFYDIMHPSSVFLNKETELFGAIWTEYSDDLHTFLQNYQKDMENFYPPACFAPKPAPPNCFHISNIPFFSFSSFHLHLPKSDNYFTPIFTLGKITPEKKTLPLAVQVHHSVCDAYHVGKFLTHLQYLLENFK